jgi:hypothetical protein
MKTITLIFAAAALTFAQAPATAPAPAAKDAMTTAPAAKKHVKKHSKKAMATTAKPAAAVSPAPVVK